MQLRVLYQKDWMRGPQLDKGWQESGLLAVHWWELGAPSLVLIMNTSLNANAQRPGLHFVVFNS